MSFKESPVQRLHHDPAELCGRDLAGLPAPEIHGQLPGQRHERPFFLSRGSLGIEQNMFPALDGLALGLIEHHAPGQFDQGPADAGVAGLGDGEITMTLARTAHPAAQSGVTADLLAVLETRPVAQFREQGSKREGTQTFGPLLGSQRLDLLGQGLELFLDGGNEFAPDVQARVQPFGKGQCLRPPFTP